MRIIGGIHRSRSILPPADTGVTRPITDRVKESLFNRLMALGVTGAGNVLDIFAGTGSLGLEALSRGAEHCTFIERDHAALTRLKKNIAALKLEAQAKVLAVDALPPAGAALPSGGVACPWLGAVAARPLRLIFCDPPYALTAGQATLGRVRTLAAALASDAEPAAVLVLRTASDVQPGAIDGWQPLDWRVHGSMAVHLYQR